MSVLLAPALLAPDLLASVPAARLTASDSDGVVVVLVAIALIVGALLALNLASRR